MQVDVVLVAVSFTNTSNFIVNMTWVVFSKLKNQLTTLPFSGSGPKALHYIKQQQIRKIDWLDFFQAGKNEVSALSSGCVNHC